MSEHLAWQRELFARHPRLFPYQDGAPKSSIIIGDGWRSIVETMLKRIDIALSGSLGSVVTIDWIQTKNGAMQVGLGGLVPDEDAKARIDEATDLAEAKSACTCEYCGDHGRLFEAPVEWLVTACKRHAGEDATEIEPSERDGIFVRRAFDGERMRLVSCRRYVPSEDRFVDIDPRSVDLED